jgi:hypothetical protein
MKRMEIGLFLVMLLAVTSCKKNHEAEKLSSPTQKARVSTTDLLFRGELNHDATVSQAKGDHVRMLVPYVETEKRSTVRYRLTEYTKNGEELRTGYVIAQEPLTKASDLFALNISNTNAALVKQRAKGSIKESTVEKIRAKRKQDNETSYAALGEELSLYAGCNNAPPVCIDWYWVTYDQYSGEVVSEMFLYTSCYDPCSFNSGGSNGNTSCAEASNKIKAGPVSEMANFSVEQESREERTVIYTWTFLKHYFDWWQFKSIEKGIHTKQQNGTWKWKSLTHVGITKTGFVMGASIDCTVHSAIPTVGMYFAGMTLNFTYSASAVCKGFPITFSKQFSMDSPIWHVDYRPTLEPNS